MDLSFLSTLEIITTPQKLTVLLLHARLCSVIISLSLPCAWSRTVRSLQGCLIQFSEINNSAVISTQHLHGNEFTRNQKRRLFRFAREEAKAHRMGCCQGGQVRAPGGLAGCGKNWKDLRYIKPGSRLRGPTAFGQIRHLSSIYLNLM